MFKKKSTYVSYGSNLSYDWLNSSHYRMLWFTVDWKNFLLWSLTEASCSFSCWNVNTVILFHALWLIWNPYAVFSALCSEVCDFLNYEHRVFNSEEFLRSRETTDHEFYKKVNKGSCSVIHSACASLPNPLTHVCVLCRF